MHHPIDRIVHTMAFVTPVMEHWLEREIAEWVHPMKDRSDHTNNYSDTFTVFSPIHLCTSVSLEDTTVRVLTAMPSQGFLTNL